jgi:hypothetical protein
LKKTDAAIAVASCAILLYEMVHVRVYSYSLPPILAYAAISISMMGFGAGAALASLLDRRCGDRLRGNLWLFPAGQAILMLLAFLIFSRSSWNVVLASESSYFPLVMEILLPCTLPYLLMGLYLAVIFSSRTESTGTLYFWNLLGSGAGCLSFVLLIRIAGAEKLVVISGLLSAAAALLQGLGRKMTAPASSLALIVCLLAALPFAAALLPFAPDPVDAVGYGLRLSAQDGLPEPAREFDEWNIVGRVEVWNGKTARVRAPETLDLRILSVDSGATTQLLESPGREGWGKDLFEQTVYGIAYRVRPTPSRVLIIGSGGGIDVHTALHWNARHVTAVEINGSTLEAVTGPFAAFLGWPLLGGRVSVVHDDGRSYVKRTREKFDVIQLTGVDTMTVYANGSMNMAEEYLYTVEAFEDYLAALTPDGVLSVLRYGSENVRLMALAAEALQKQGISRPGDRLVLYRQSNASGILVKRRAFTSAELSSLADLVSRRVRNGVSLPHFEKWNFFLSDPVDIVCMPSNPCPTAEAADRPAFVPTDDRPYYMLSLWFGAEVRPVMMQVFQLLKKFWIAVTALAFLLILGPTVIVGMGRGARREILWSLPFFFFIGCGYMIIELGIMHRFALFLGSPGASIAVVLTGLLVASGAGSWTSNAVRKPYRKKILVLALALAGLAAALLLLSDAVFEAAGRWGAGIAWRGAAAAVLIAPLGFAMGWFFPLGLKMLGEAKGSTGFIAWAVSVNGFASVVGANLALPMSMFLGFRALTAAALVGYLVAALLVLMLAERGSRG